MMPLNINIFVDVIALLVDNPTEECIFLFDDSPTQSNNLGRGTPGLQTLVCPGQLVRWSLMPIDVQTPVWLAGISFGACTSLQSACQPADKTVTNNRPESPASYPPWARYWEGYVPHGPMPGTIYPYRLEFQFGGLTGRTVMINGPALVYRQIQSIAPAAQICAGNHVEQPGINATRK